jgi:hypothetical protein
MSFSEISKVLVGIDSFNQLIEIVDAASGVLPPYTKRALYRRLSFIESIKLGPNMRVVAIVQARLGSIRLPEKVLQNICDKPLIELLLARLSHSTQVDEIIVATSKEPMNDSLQLFVESLGFKCTRGSEEDVLHRFHESAKKWMQMLL